MAIAEGLIEAGKVRATSATPGPGRPNKRSLKDAIEAVKPGRKPTTPIPGSDIRFDQIGHWPQPSNDKRRRCRYCSDGFSKVYCT